MYRVYCGVKGRMFQLCNLSQMMLKLILKKKKRKCELHIVMTYRADRIKIFYILEFASFCKKKRKKEKVRDENVYLFYLYINDMHENSAMKTYL